MLSVQSEVNHCRLFQSWQPDPVLKRTTGDWSSFIELPCVSSYQQLIDAPAFAEIQTQFLADITELKLLANTHVNHRYDRAIDAFKNMLKKPCPSLVEGLLPLYRETRFHVHQLVIQLRDHLAQGNDYIALILHECLNDIGLCPAGVHSRFATSILDLQASVATGLDGHLFKVRNDLFRSFIHSFMFQLQREGFAITYQAEIHWFNGLYNLHCQQLGLPVIDDPLAHHHFGSHLHQRFSSAVGLAVNACTVLRELSDNWSERLEDTLTGAGCSAWLTRPTRGDEPTAVAINLLNSKVFYPINSMMGTVAQHPLDLTSLMDDAGDDSFHLQRHKEKMLAWVAGSFFAEDTSVFAVISGTQYIGTINQLYFWVFDSLQPLSIGGACVFTSDQHTSLRLSHLRRIDFSTWSESTVFALLTQALEQTAEASEIAAFFLNPQANGQVGQLSDDLIQALSTLLSNKLEDYGEVFKHTLCQCLCDYFASCTTTVVLPQVIALLINTPLLGPVLSRLCELNKNISPITSRLNSWQIVGFSPLHTGQLMPGDCQRLYRQALRLEQGQVIGDLLLTGHCDGLVHRANRKNGRTALGILARHGIVDGVKYLLNLAGVAINHRDDVGHTPLHLAVINNHLPCVMELLRVPSIQVNALSVEGFSPLNCAAALGLVDICKVLLKAPDIDINRSDNQSWTPLCSAAARGHAKVVKELVKARGIHLNQGNRLGCSPLLCASHCGNVDVVEELLCVPGVLVNKVSKDGCTSLNSAAAKGHVPVVERLVKAPGIKVNLKDHDGWTPLNSAALMGHLGVVEILLDAPDILVNEGNDLGFSPLHNASVRGHVEIVEKLLGTSGVLINKVSEDGGTSGVLVNQVGNDGCTALHMAAGRGRVPVVKALLKARGIDVNLKSHEGWTPLNCAVSGGYLDVVETLLDVPGILVSEGNSLGCSPLHCAVLQGHTAIVEALLALAPSVDVNHQSLDGFTPLHCAIKRGRLEIAKALLAMRGIDVNVKEHSNSLTPLHFACHFGFADCVRALLQMPDIRVNEICSGGFTPLRVALLFRHVDCARELLKHTGALSRDK